MVNIKLSYFLIFAICLVSCWKNSKQISDNYVRKLAAGDFKIPSVYGFDILFVRSDNEQIAATNIGTLHAVYVARFSLKFSSFYDFLTAALNQREIIPKAELNLRQAEYFVLDEMITDDFQNISRAAYIEKYCNRKYLKEYVLKKDGLESASVNSILYYLFISGFEIQTVDTEDSFVIKSMN
jgi:hypothetical protein